MKLTKKLALSQLKINRSRTVWTLAGIALSTAMITAVFGFAVSGDDMFRTHIGGNEGYLNIYIPMLYGISTVFISIIMIASVIVVSNSFRVSAGERISQFGMLKSVGATKKQITDTIMYEGIFLCLIGIPAGVIFGLLVNFAGIQIVDYFLASLRVIDSEIFKLYFIISWQVILLSVLFAFVTVYISAWLPARKAAGIAAIDAIRGAGEYKVESKKIRANRFIKTIFGFEGSLASKSLKRSRRNFRATVVSLTISIVLFIVAGSFGIMMNTVSSVYFLGIDVNVSANFRTDDRVIRDEDGEIIERRYSSLNSNLADDVTKRMRNFPGSKIISVGSDSHSYSTIVPHNMLSPRMQEYLAPHVIPGDTESSHPVVLLSTDAETYAGLCKQAGVPLGSNILINQYTWYYTDGGRSVFAPLIFNNQTIRLINRYTDEEIDLPLHGELTIGNIPQEVLVLSGATVSVLVPELETFAYQWFMTTDDATGFTEFAETVMRDMITLEEGLSFMNVFNVDEEIGYMQNIGQLVMVFIYGFIIMLTLIGLTNVISTISTNVRSRSREFAILQSVGMTKSGLNRMLNLESILCSVKSLVIGIPVGIVGAYIIYMYIAAPVEFAFIIPWIPILQCILGVLAVTWITIHYAASRLRGGSIVEKIRADGIS